MDQRVIVSDASPRLVHGSAIFAGKVTLHLGFTCIQTGLNWTACDSPGSHANVPSLVGLPVSTDRKLMLVRRCLRASNAWCRRSASCADRLKCNAELFCDADVEFANSVEGLENVQNLCNSEVKIRQNDASLVEQPWMTCASHRATCLH